MPSLPRSGVLTATPLPAAAYFERIWDRVPPGAPPQHFELRCRFLLSRVKPGAAVLDVGCGEGAFSDRLARAGCRTVGVDIAEEPLRRARARFPEREFHHCPPLPGRDWDVIWAGELIEHVQDCAGLLEELRSVLAPGGRLLLSTPDHTRWKAFRLALSRKAFERHFDPDHDHVRFFTAGTLHELVEDAGFERTTLSSSHGVLLLSSYRSGPARGASSRSTGPLGAC